MSQVARGNFPRALRRTLVFEGRYSDNPNDPGGRTDYGISERSHPEAWSDGKVTPDEAHGIYLRHYWRPIMGDRLPHDVAAALFDFSVHSPRSVAVANLQRLVWLPAFPDQVDGRMGPKTLERVWQAVRTNDQDARLATRLTRERGLFLGRWIAADPCGRGQFAPGFFRRLTDMVAYSWED